MFGLISLPYEVLWSIVSHIDFDDVFNLGRTCKDLRFLLTEESICKSIVQTKIPYSNEAVAASTRAGGNAAALRRAAKRREAIATASPFIVATVGFGDAYLYCNGVLCYTLDDRVRILDLHNSGQDETVISIPGLLTQALMDIADHSRGIFQILYYSDNVISCLYKSSGLDPTAWLIAFNIRTKRVLVTEDLVSTDKIFVRHNKRFLYYGTHSEIGTDGYKKWVIHGFDLERGKRFDQKVHLPDMVGSEIGSTICFEFYNQYFYALSNQTSFEVEEIDWTSFYHCVRFPLESPCRELLEKTENKSMWRRQHQEGPIDDRWTSLRLDTDETTGELQIVESRKEWYLGSSRSQITYYTTEIIFPDLSNSDELDFAYSEVASSSSASSLALASPLSVASASSSSAASIFSTSSSSESTSSTTSTATSVKLQFHDLTTLPDDPILRLLQPDDHPHHLCPPARLPQNTHPGDDGSSKPTFTLTKSRIRYYHTSASTYLDLVDDPLPTDWEGKQRLRLRAGSRKLGAPLLHEHGPDKGLLREPSSDLRTALKEMYCERPISYWPPAQDPDHPNKGLDAIYKLLNPPSHLTNVEGTADDRSMVYVTGSYDKPQAIIFVGFDPAINLVGLKRWGGFSRKGVGEGPHVDGRAAGHGDEEERFDESAYVDVGEVDRVVSIDRKGKGKPRRSPAVQVLGGQAIVELGSQAERPVMRIQRTNCAWTEKAMYRDIGLGFYFGLLREES